jgi:hypothetical protein
VTLVKPHFLTTENAVRDDESEILSKALDSDIRRKGHSYELADYVENFWNKDRD